MSIEKNNHSTQEQELWERISTTSGAERAEVLDELSHIAYKKDNYIECLHLVDTSIELYFTLGGAENYLKELIHLYQGKSHCLENLKRFREAAEVFEELAKLHQIDNDEHGHLCAIRTAARAWYEVSEWQKSLDGHLKAKDLIDLDATPFTMGMDLINIGMALAKLDRHEEAIESYLSARKFFKEAKNPEYVNWCDNYLAISYIATGNGSEAKFHSQLYLNYCKVAEDLGMEAYARYRLGTSCLISECYEDAIFHLTRSLELLTMEDEKDWEDIVAANKGLAKAFGALGREEEARERLERLKSIEETING